jgi:membrane protein YqaA with SNARE-associated domain
MQWLLKLYDKTLVWSHHRHAARYLAAVSFVEASVFPIPPYFMLAPMALAKPDKAMNYALLATVASVCGGVLGYCLGYLLFHPVVLPILKLLGYTESYDLIAAHLQSKGFWAVLVAGFMPIPYKLVAIGAGVVEIPLLSFVTASIFGRALKFFAVAGLIKIGGQQMDQMVRRVIPKFSLILGSIFLALVAYKFS